MLFYSLAKLMTNKAAAAFAKQLGMDRRFAASTSQETLADRFESYVGALWACNGSSAVLEFLAPLFGRQMLNVVLDDVKEVAEAQPIMDPAAAATTPKPTSELKEGKSTLTTPVTKAKALYTGELIAEFDSKPELTFRLASSTQLRYIRRRQDQLCRRPQEWWMGAVLHAREALHELLPAEAKGGLRSLPIQGAGWLEQVASEGGRDWICCHQEVCSSFFNTRLR